MTTDTRTTLDWKLRPAPRERDVQGCAPTRRSERQGRSDDHWNQQLPDPAYSPFRDPETSQKSPRHQCGGTGEQTDDEQDSEAKFKNGLQRTGYRGMGGGNTHHLLPNLRRMAVLDVSVNQSCITFGAI